MELYQLGEEHQVRQAMEADIPQLFNIWKEANSSFSNVKGFDSRPPIDDEFAHKQLKDLVVNQDQNFRFWVALDSANKILGYSTTQPLWPTPDKYLREGVGFIMTYIDQKHKGEGIGQRLFEYNMDYCRNHTTLKYCFGFRLPANALSVKITDKSGYETIGHFPQREDFPLFDIIMLSL